MDFCDVFFFQAEDGIRDLVRSRGLGDVYKRQIVGGGMAYTFYKAEGKEIGTSLLEAEKIDLAKEVLANAKKSGIKFLLPKDCLLYTSDAADERSSVDLGGRRIIKKKKKEEQDDSGHRHKQLTEPRCEMRPATV